MIKKYKNYLLGVIEILLTLTMFVGVKYLMKPKYEELPEVKLKNKEDENKFAIMVQNENKDGYQEYDGNEFPKEGYEFNDTETKCIDNNGSIVEHAISFTSETNTVTIETDKTIYCTLYFDKKDPLKITNVAVDTSVPYQVKLTVSATGGDGNYTYSVENSCHDNCNAPYSSCYNKEKVKVLYSGNIITIDDLHACYYHNFIIKVTDGTNNIEYYTVSDIFFTHADGGPVCGDAFC